LKGNKRYLLDFIRENKSCFIAHFENTNKIALDKLEEEKRVEIEGLDEYGIIKQWAKSANDTNSEVSKIIKRLAKEAFVVYNRKFKFLFKKKHTKRLEVLVGEIQKQADRIKSCESLHGFVHTQNHKSISEWHYVEDRSWNDAIQIHTGERIYCPDLLFWVSFGGMAESEISLRNPEDLYNNMMFELLECDSVSEMISVIEDGYGITIKKHGDRFVI
jgi:hypothetical protein